MSIIVVNAPDSYISARALKTRYTRRPHSFRPRFLNGLRGWKEVGLFHFIFLTSSLGFYLKICYNGDVRVRNSFLLKKL